MAQIIDENAKVCEGLENYLDSIGITKAGLNYHTLSIIGCQSSGKSTLLNALFHTTFATMNESTGRQQTTKGIHAAFNDQNVLIFDIEGSDSRERGDADALFERKAALFGLALSEVVMVNMWENDIGRYNASSIPLLRTVFEVNLQLFATSQESKCHLLFVIRDSTQKDEIIEGQVRRDLDLIWKGLVLPPNLQGKKFEDFFIFHFFSLPHLRLKPEEFKEAAARLARKFTDPTDPDFFFSQPMGKLIPGDGLYQYINSVWEAISENRELNLPSQRKTLSNFRCEEFMNQALEEFEKSAEEEIRSKITDKPLPEFQEIANKIVSKAISDYNQAAGKYVREIVVEKRQLLKEKMSDSLSPSFTLNSQLYRDEKVAKFTEYVDSLPDQLETAENWEMDANKARDETISDIEHFIESSKVTDFSWSFDTTTLFEDLTRTIHAKLDKIQKEMESRIFYDYNVDYKDRINVFLDEAQSDMWEKIRKEMNNSIRELRTKIDAILKRNTIDRKTSDGFSSNFYKSTVTQVLTASEFVPQKMNIKFEEKFLQDENHNSRKWGPEDDISTEFEVARDAGMNVLRMFTNCCLREPGEPIPPNDLLTKQMLSPIKVQAIESEFNEQIEKNYIDAVRIKESMITHNEVPVWMWIVIFVTGYQKLLKAIKHPITAIVLIAFIALVYYLYKTGKLDICISYIKAFITKALRFFIDLLKKNTNDLELPPSIRESAKKSVDLDKEALTKSIAENGDKSNNESLEISIDSTQDESPHKSTDSNESPSAPKQRKRRSSGKPQSHAANCATLQPGKINLIDLQNEVKRRRTKAKAKAENDV